MNIKELTYLLQNPEKITKAQAQSLEKISDEFPYFQSVRPLLLKALKNQESFRYNQELKITAAYTADRSVLFDFITSDLFKHPVASNKVKQKRKKDINVVDPQEIKSLPRIPLNDAVTMKMQEAEDVLDPTLFASKGEENINKEEESHAKGSFTTHQERERPIDQHQHITPEEILQVDKPFDFSKKETHSFAEWLKLTSTSPIDQLKDKKEHLSSQNIENTDDVEKTLVQKGKFELIDEFIANNPKIQPASKDTPKRNLAKEHRVSNNELMTETLARVYVAQKNYKKAIQAYHILILKNPEKSGFFADQIRAIQKLQENK
ncbi:hypothetical protein J8281_05695 [Aquimarina sp. U1-2]|uniref:hypothetical protein n=1 Tax=Aquimarina sp. U1-2 TaxID=2823141 RepID=UPI001AECC17D|nr:hypothetical protein [Aquimarina sp. U1-2]MBP2831677.1 hypothetical protein [Aquimarina sp. U1-2]